MLEDVVRYACGKINRSETDRARRTAERGKDAGEPSPRIVVARDFFNARCFKNGGKGSFAGDAIGILWLVGKLDVPDMDETALLDAARRWWFGRGVYFRANGHKMPKYERSSRSEPSAKESKAERDYNRYEAALLDADPFDADCLRTIMETELDAVFGNWVSRVIQTAILGHVRIPVAFLASDEDERKFQCAKRALIAMSGAEAMKKRVA